MLSSAVSLSVFIYRKGIVFEEVGLFGTGGDGDGW